METESHMGSPNPYPFVWILKWKGMQTRISRKHILTHMQIKVKYHQKGSHAGTTCNHREKVHCWWWDGKMVTDLRKHFGNFLQNKTLLPPQPSSWKLPKGDKNCFKKPCIQVFKLFIIVKLSFSRCTEKTLVLNQQCDTVSAEWK